VSGHADRQTILVRAASIVRASGDGGLAEELESLANPFHTRDALLRQCALTHFPGSAYAAARDIESGWDRYATTAGKREYGLAECPQRHRGKPAEFYWRLCSLGFSPRKYRQILSILLQSDIAAQR
jgi:hypothetical protein